MDPKEAKNSVNLSKNEIIALLDLMIELGIMLIKFLLMI